MSTHAIIRKELQLYFTSPLVYALGAVFLALSGYLFYTKLHWFVLYGGMYLERGLWEIQFHDMRRLLLFLVPMLTMRLLAEERRLGTLELLWTYPLRDGAIVLGKYLACLAVLALVIGGTLVYPLLLGRLHPVHLPGVMTGYLGLLLLVSAFVACGLFVSSLTESQLVAGASTYGVLLFFWLLNWNEAAVSDGALPWLRALSLFDHFEVFAQGGVDTRDVSYFVLFTAVFLCVTLLGFESRRWRGVR
jgi:ABC-2 type transport system permease protein